MAKKLDVETSTGTCVAAIAFRDCKQDGCWLRFPSCVFNRELRRRPTGDVIFGFDGECCDQLCLARTEWNIELYSKECAK